MGRALYQYLAVLYANISTLGYAISIGWVASVMIQYDSDNSPLPSGRVKLEELAWIGSILGIGGLAGTIFIGWFADCVGRKNSLIAMAVPQVISYTLIIYAQNVYYLYLSRFLMGFAGGALYVVIPLMTAEIAEDRVRGRLCTVLVLGSSGGTLLGFMAGHFLEYAETPRFSLLFSVLFLASYSFMPETPYYLMKTNRMEETEKSLRFYRNMSKNPSVQENKAFEYELSKLKYSYTEMQRKDSENPSSTPLAISDFINRPFSICCVLMFAHEVCGVFTMTSYASMIFAKSGSTISPGISSIIVGAIQVVGSYISTLFVDRLGRKLLMVISFSGAAFCHVILATYIYLSTATTVNLDGFNWVPIVSFSGMLLIAGCGAIPVPYVLIAEILPDKIRNMGITLCLCISWGLTFVLFKLFPALLLIIQLYGCVYLFALCCFATVLYVLMFVPETKGKSLDEILIILKAK